jgi:hypothetical protein
MITEQDIQRAFFAHLQEFYKYRYEYVPGTFVTERDALAEGSIIADGVVQFTKPDGNTFLGTFEATSADKPEEVKFVQNNLHHIWDCLAFACLMTAVVIGYLYFAKLNMLLGLGLLSVFGLIFTLWLLLFSIWYFGASGWRKYRYIYAVTQFKQYFADEQWIVLGQDVFPHSEDPYMSELRSQCTFNGFGLATVDRHGGVQTLITPSRLGIYGHDRSDAHWLTGTTAFQQVRNTWEKLPEKAGPITALWNKMMRPLHYLVWSPLNSVIKRIAGTNESEFNRFMQSFSYQKGVTALGLSLLFLTTYKTYKHPAFHVDEEINTLAQFHDRRSATYQNPEDQPGYVYKERLPITYGGSDDRGVPKQYPGLQTESLGNANTVKSSAPKDGIESDKGEVQTIDLTSLNEEAEATEAKSPAIDSPVTYSEGAVASSDAKGIAKPVAKSGKVWSWCNSLKDKSGWLVQDNYFVSPEGAEERIKQLRSKKMECFTVAATCLGSKKGGHYVFLKKLFDSEESAIKHYKTSVATLKKQKIDTGRTIVKKIGG